MEHSEVEAETFFSSGRMQSGKQDVALSPADARTPGPAHPSCHALGPGDGWFSELAAVLAVVMYSSSQRQNSGAIRYYLLLTIVLFNFHFYSVFPMRMN